MFLYRCYLNRRPLSTDHIPHNQQFATVPQWSWCFGGLPHMCVNNDQHLHSLVFGYTEQRHTGRSAVVIFSVSIYLSILCAWTRSPGVDWMPGFFSSKTCPHKSLWGKNHTRAYGEKTPKLSQKLPMSACLLLAKPILKYCHCIIHSLKRHNLNNSPLHIPGLSLSGPAYDSYRFDTLNESLQRRFRNQLATFNDDRDAMAIC